jgi:prepilin-type N-terminal cleavage/methylation domain-containing protein
MRPPRPRRRDAFTLPELALVLAIAALMSLIGVRQLQLHLDRLSTRGAVAESALLVTRAREEALAQHALVSLRVDTAAGAVTLHARGERLAIHPLARRYGVTLSATRDSIAFDARGLGYGAANMTLIARRREAANTLVVSRLGRVRY